MYEELTNRFVQKSFRYSKVEQERIREASLFAVEFHGSQKRQSGEPYIVHPYAVAEILMSLKMDVDTVVQACCTIRSRIPRRHTRCW